MDIPDLTTLSLASFLGLLLLVAAIDVATAIVLAVAHGTFSADVVMGYIRTHVLMRIFPIFGLALLGHGITKLGIPAIAPAWAAAIASFLGYIVETVGSLRDSFSTNATPPPAA